MKIFRILFTSAFAVLGFSAFAQDFSDPQYAKWGETAEERKENILNSTFLKESIDNRDFQAATDYLKALVEKCPTASENIYANGIRLYKSKIARAKSLTEKKGYVDSLMWVYDLRNQYFGSHPKRGTAYILERKARELLTYDASDRAGIRKVFVEAIDAAIAQNGKAEPEFIAIYFKNLCDDFKNDEILASEVLSEYEKLAPMFDNIDEKDEEFRGQFETCFGMSGAANCDNLEDMFAKKLAETPDDPAVLGQAVALMSRAGCESDFFFATAEHYYSVKPSSETALFLAQAFQNRKDFDKANKYLREAVVNEQDPAERVKLLVRIAVVELAAQRYAASAEAAEEACSVDPENGYAYFILAQAYALGNGGCSGLDREATYWVAYDTMNKAVSRLDNEPETQKQAQASLANYRRSFPTAEECFFNELKEGAAYTLKCGVARGKSTTVRFRPQ